MEPLGKRKAWWRKIKRERKVRWGRPVQGPALPLQLWSGPLLPDMFRQSPSCKDAKGPKDKDTAGTGAACAEGK